MTFKFYLPLNNPGNMTGVVGGAIDLNSEVPARLGSLFVHRTGLPEAAATGIYQHRKVFVRNEDSVTVTDVSIWLDAVEHMSQISIGVESGTAPQITGAATIPSGVVFSSPNSYASGVVLGDLTANALTVGS